VTSGKVPEALVGQGRLPQDEPLERRKPRDHDRLRIVGDPVLEIELQKRLERRQLHPLLVGKRAIHDTDPGRTAGADGRGLLGERRLGGGKRRGGNRRGDEECRSGE
jgi:hypothetical protein